MICDAFSSPSSSHSSQSTLQRSTFKIVPSSPSSAGLFSCWFIFQHSSQKRLVMPYAILRVVFTILSLRSLMDNFLYLCRTACCCSIPQNYRTLRRVKFKYSQFSRRHVQDCSFQCLHFRVVCRGGITGQSETTVVQRKSRELDGRYPKCDILR